jgi:hypothetical protein
MDDFIDDSKIDAEEALMVQKLEAQRAKYQRDQEALEAYQLRKQGAGKPVRKAAALSTAANLGRGFRPTVRC